MCRPAQVENQPSGAPNVPEEQIRKLHGVTLGSRLVALGIGLVLSCALAEAASRLFADRLFDLGSPFIRFDPELGWIQRAGATGHHRNEAGVRVAVEGDHLGIRRRPQAYRESGTSNVLVVGDSITAGTQVRYEETWPEQLEAMLRGRRTNIQVVNAAVDGYDLAQAYWMAKRLWPRFRPVVLVVSIYLGNDIVDYERYASAALPWRERSLKPWLRRHSYAYKLAVGLKYKLLARRANTGTHAAGDGWRPRSVHAFEAMDGPQRTKVRRQFLNADLLPYLKGDDHVMQTTLRLLDSFRDLARSQSVPLVLVILPTKQQVIPSQRAEFISLHRLTESDLFRPQKALLSWAQRHHVPCVDVTPALRAQASPDTLFWPVDLHLSPAGHRVVAGAAHGVVGEILASLRRTPDAPTFPLE
jgi:hypothetical protein